MSRTKNKIILGGCGDIEGTCVYAHTTDHIIETPDSKPYVVEKLKVRMAFEYDYMRAKTGSIDGVMYHVTHVQGHPNANRVVLTLTRPRLECATHRFKLIHLEDGKRCDFYLRDGITSEVDGVLWHQVSEVVSDYQSSSLDSIWQVYIDNDVAKQLTNRTVFELDDKRYAVQRLVDIDKHDAIPHAVTHMTRWPLG